MKTPEDEAFDELARKQGAWGGGFPAKRAMAADKLQEPVCDKDPQGCWNVRCQLGKQCKNLAQPPLPVQEPAALVIDGVLVKSALPEKYTGHLYTTPPQREWIGLIKEDYVLVNQLCIDPLDAAELVNRLLKERNHGT